MTKKRFTLSKDTEWWFVEDNTIKVNEFGYRDDLTGEDKYRGLQQDLTEQEVVDLLNELAEENKDIKRKLEECKNNKLFSRRELEKENKELKQELGSFKPIIFETENGATTLYEKRGLND